MARRGMSSFWTWFYQSQQLKQLEKQTKLMQQNHQVVMPVTYQSGVASAFEAGRQAGWAECNKEWLRHGHKPEGGCQ